MVAQNTERSSGRTTAEEVTREVAAELEDPIRIDLPDEKERKFRTAGFSRMRTEWKGPDAAMIATVHQVVQRKIEEHFSDAYTIMYELYDLIRTYKTDANGEVLHDEYNWPLWAQTATGAYVEDWGKLTYKQREKFLFQLTTRLFEWEQKASEAWAEAMFSKAIWEEAFSTGFESMEGARPTVDDRTARGRLASKEDRYFAIYCSYYSRKADALVRTLQLLGQRIKDVHAPNGR